MLGTEGAKQLLKLGPCRGSGFEWETEGAGGPPQTAWQWGPSPIIPTQMNPALWSQMLWQAQFPANLGVKSSRLSSLLSPCATFRKARSCSNPQSGEEAAALLHSGTAAEHRLPGSLPLRATLTLHTAGDCSVGITFANCCFLQPLACNALGGCLNEDSRWSRWMQNNATLKSVWWEEEAAVFPGTLQDSPASNKQLRTTSCSRFHCCLLKVDKYRQRKRGGEDGSVSDRAMFLIAAGS